MGSDIVIRAEGLSKKYLIGHQVPRERYTALRDVIARNARNFRRSVGDMFCGRPNVSGDEVEEFLALKDVSFEIRQGEVVGVIGRNGAGKSTLLKILSRITEPSSGRVELRGRVASLLEVGTGFHPELSGRENIYLNGAILGMTRSEIRRKFDAIVTFAEVEKFLDTPVKRYSSGMYVRLAFAVAAHLEPEILVVDEVLAVGDAEFQKKCIDKMGDVAKCGRTVLFVSHNLSTIRALCDSAIVLRTGTMTFQGEIATALGHYNDTKPSSIYEVPATASRKGLYVSRCCVERAGDGEREAVLALRIFSKKDDNIAIHVFMKDASGLPVGFATAGGLGMPLIAVKENERNEFRVVLNTACLARGRYLVSIGIDGSGRERLDTLEDVLWLDNNPPLPEQCSEVLHQEWGYGCVHIECTIALSSK
jgi:lipopolysaccharide transport system ATP-binding protein